MKFYFLALFAMLSLCTYAQTSVYCYNTMPGSRGVRPINFAVFQNRLYFVGTDSVISGRELWVLDSVTAPTVAIDFKVGTASGKPYNIFVDNDMYVYNNKMYLCLDSTATGQELYSYDGVSRPALVADLHPGTTSSAPYDFIELNGKIYFFVSLPGYEMWEYNPGTNAAHKIPVAPSLLGALSLPVAMPAVNKIVFNNSAFGNVLVYDQSRDTIVTADSIFTSVNGIWPSEYLLYNNKVYYTAQYTGPSATGRELYMYDGINSPPTRLTDLNPGSGDGFTKDLILVGNTIYFNGNDGGSSGFQLYKYDLSTSTATKVHNVGTGSSASAGPTAFHMYNGKLYFMTIGSYTGKIWSYDFVDSPRVVIDYCWGKTNKLPSGSFFNYAGSMYFAGTCDSTGYELYRFTDSVLSVSHLDIHAGSFNLYPNPNNGHFTLKGRVDEDRKLNIRVLNTMGQVVYKDDIQSVNRQLTKDIILDGVAEGLYILEIGAGDETKQMRIIVQH